MAARMVRANWLKYAQVFLIGTMLITGSAFAADGAAPPDVDVNWRLLDRLGQESTLPQLLLRDIGKDDAVDRGSPSVRYRPYRPEGEAVTPPRRHVAPPRTQPLAPGPVYRPYQPKSPAVVPPLPKSAPMNPESVKPVAVEKAAPLPLVPPVLPKVEPSTPAPVIPEAPDVESVKAESPKVETPPAALDATLEQPALPALPSPPSPAPVAPELPPRENPGSETPTMPEAPAAGDFVVPPKAEPAPAPAPAPADLPTARVDNNTLVVTFAAEEATIPDAAKPLLEELAKRLVQDEGLSMQFLAYASGDEAQASKARRLSLTRALTVRQFFLDRGVRSTRMEVRAMGNRGAGGRSPSDRVEIVVVSR